ncbi:amidohydrolase family protein [Paraburkholderia kirstenboschensis]|uniref:Amidohydrolase family protein n=1 Tax=Paraburkholderia kirstenboschensis TaxID=1245436 RepID=A0ABZ0EL23_9BURK|nr:amidohydrolase family protein [Paraburkholderia kirstenboschensis]WOD16987.1 amidohydrolase family protein [Paraburkholderia kirstenboschensis]
MVGIFQNQREFFPTVSGKDVCRPLDRSGNGLRNRAQTGRVWLKLSGPYLTSKAEQPPYEDLAQSILALTKRFPERLVWGTDWPHATEEHKPDDAKMLDWLASLLPSSELEASTFVQNAAELYQFWETRRKRSVLAATLGRALRASRFVDIRPAAAEGCDVNPMNGSLLSWLRDAARPAEKQFAR